MPTTPSWLNRTVVGAGLTSLLADVGYELATALLPSFLLVLGLPTGAAASVLGATEAAAEFLSNAAKILVGWWSDRVGKRKALVVFGYALTGSAFTLCAVAAAWPLVTAAKSLAWLGKGIRGPLRNAIISDAVDPAHRGKAFGFHRAGDTLGAVLGPLLGAAIVYDLPREWFGAWATGDPAWQHRAAFWFTLIPGLAAAVAFALLIREQRLTPKPGLRLGASVAAMPPDYRQFLIGVGLFGMGDFSHTLLILFATSQMARGTYDLPPGAALPDHWVWGILFYAWRNFVQAVAAFPAGVLGDRFGHRLMLTVGYATGVVTMAGFSIATLGSEALPLIGWLLLFALAGVYMAVQEALEPAIVPELVPDRAVHGTAFGVLAVVNGLGDVGASLIVGGLVAAFGWAAGLGYAAAMMAAGAAWLAARPPRG